LLYPYARTIFRKDFWEPMLEWMKRAMLELPRWRGETMLISPKDLEGLILENDIHAIVGHFKESYNEWKVDQEQKALERATAGLESHIHPTPLFARRVHDITEAHYDNPLAHPKWPPMISHPRDDNKPM